MLRLANRICILHEVLLLNNFNFNIYVKAVNISGISYEMLITLSISYNIYLYVHVNSVDLALTCPDMCTINMLLGYVNII